MTFEEQEYYIDSLNSNNLKIDYHLINLSENIDFGYFWSGPNAGQSYFFRTNYYPSKFYLIKYEGKYCSIVEDRNFRDLQVFTKPEFRNKKIVYNAFQKTIFPHLKQSRKFQEVTTSRDNLEAENLIKKLGFELIDTKNSILIYRKSLKKINPLLMPKTTIEQIKLEEYQFAIAQCFEKIELISKHIELVGNHSSLLKSFKQSLKYKSKILNYFDNEIQLFIKE